MCQCEQSQIILNTATLAKIVGEPDWILQNEGSFWQDEKPQRLTRLWAERVNYSIPYDEWRKQMMEWAGMPLDERKGHVLSRNAREIMERRDAFRAKALPHLCSYLPPDADLNVTIHFTAFIPARAFAMEDIVINVAAPYWNGNVANILNTLVHEIFHAGYGYCRDLGTQDELGDDTAHSLLRQLQNEGSCTYVAYRAQPVLPAPDEKDYRLLDSGADVARLVGDVNRVFSEVGKLPREEVERLAWERCVEARGYYVVGAHICRTIEEQRGKQALIETLVKGPVSFVQLYNSLIGDGMRIQVPTLES